MSERSNYKISVIVPCFNSGATITRTIDSLRNQTLLPYEIIVVDDGSFDESTLNILDSLRDIILIRQSNKGLSSARNVGVSHATGTHIFFLDSDDWIESNALHSLSQASSNYPCSFICSQLFLEGDKRGPLIKSFNLFEQLFLNQLPYSIFIPRSIAISLKYDERMNLGYED